MFASIFGKSPPATEWRQFSIAGNIYKVRWQRRRNARKMTMRWRHQALHITTPHGVTDQMIKAFIAEHTNWISREKQRLEDLARISPAPTSLPSGEDAGPLVFFRGAPTKVRLFHNPGQRGKSRIAADNGIISIHLPAASRLRPARVLENWMKARARESIMHELDSVLDHLGEAPVPVSIRDQKSRWGSCSTTRRLSFNWRLIMAPPLSLRYVAVHEAAHLCHHDHSPHFWQLVEKIMPDYRPHQDWLQQHQIALFADIGMRLHGLAPEDPPSP